jgi:hypothetical protein
VLLDLGSISVQVHIANEFETDRISVRAKCRSIVTSEVLGLEPAGPQLPQHLGRSRCESHRGQGAFWAYIVSARARGLVCAVTSRTSPSELVAVIDSQVVRLTSQCPGRSSCKSYRSQADLHCISQSWIRAEVRSD